MAKYLWLASCLLLATLALFYATSKRSHCFSQDFVLRAPHALPQQTIPPEIQQILKQRFVFLGSGNQSYAFESEDHLYVLKLLKYHTLEQLTLIDYLPSWGPIKTLQAHQALHREKKLQRVLSGFALAGHHCGIVYLALNPLLPDPIDIRDQAYRPHKIHLTDVPFAIQYKAATTGQVLASCLANQNLSQAALKLAALFALFNDELTQGIADADHNVVHNTGFYGDRPIRIDFGKLKKDDLMKNPLNAYKELHKIAYQRILPWIKKYYPSHYEYFTIQMQEILVKYHAPAL
jgi:hypothetical protein